jgi:uncharacterized membrane-anchored protein
MHTRLITLTAAALCLAPVVGAQEVSSPAELEATFEYQQGVVTLKGGLATLTIPPSFRFLGPDDSERLLTEGWGNPPGQAPLGMIIPAGLSPFSDEGWGVVITYDEDGYVEDDEAEKINYTELLTEMQKDTRAESKAREKEGYDAIELIGWAAPPRYEASTHKLYWAQELQFGSSPESTLNYNIRVLGRRGVLVLNAVAGMHMLNAVQADMQSVMSFVDFNEGHRYTDFVPGADRVAVYGIGALVAGKLAAKAGLFKLLLPALLAAKKFVVAGVVALLAILKKVFGKREPAGEVAQ